MASRKMRQQGKAAQRKGRKFELWILKDLWKHAEKDWPWENDPRPDDGYHPPREFEDWHFEAKNQEKTYIWEWTKQAQEDAKAQGKPWVVVMKRRGEGPLAVLNWKEFKNLVCP